MKKPRGKAKLTIFPKLTYFPPNSTDIEGFLKLLWPAVKTEFGSVDNMTYLGNDGKHVYLCKDNMTAQAEVVRMHISKVTS